MGEIQAGKLGEKEVREKGESGRGRSTKKSEEEVENKLDGRVGREDKERSKRP